MYCVRCGVKLNDSVDRCPLCQTPVWNPDGNRKQESLYSEELPPKGNNPQRVLVVLLTILSLTALFTVFIVSYNLPGRNSWAGYVLLGIPFAYIVFILPLWFRRSWPEIFVPAAHLCAAGYLYYIAYATKGDWFWSFALPIVGISCLLLTAVSVLLKYIHHNRGYIIGGFIIGIGGFSMLVELFSHLTFGFPMFRWSIYSFGACFVIGMFIILIEIIKPMKAFFKRNFFF